MCKKHSFPCWSLSINAETLPVDKFWHPNRTAWVSAFQIMENVCLLASKIRSKKNYYDCRRATYMNMDMNFWDFPRKKEQTSKGKISAVKTLKSNRKWRQMLFPVGSNKSDFTDVQIVTEQQLSLESWKSHLTAYLNKKAHQLVGQCKTRRHPTATVVYNACCHLFRKRTFITVYRRLALANLPWQQYDTGRLCNA